MADELELETAELVAIKEPSELDELLALVNSDEEEGFCEPLSETEARFDPIA